MKTGFICGAFDLLHPGHLFTFKECKKYCDKLVVGLHVNPQSERPEKNKPIETVYERYCRLMSCKYVDEVIPYEDNRDLINLLHTAGLDVRFLGDDYKLKEYEIIGKDILPITYISRGHNWSSSNLRKRI